MLTCNSVMGSSHATVAQRITTPASSERGKPHRRKSTPEGETISTAFSSVSLTLLLWLLTVLADLKETESDKPCLPAQIR
jgi:hypothetical protein